MERRSVETCDEGPAGEQAGQPQSSIHRKKKWTHSRIKAARANSHAPRPLSVGGSETPVPSPCSRFRFRKLDCLVVSVVETSFPTDWRISEGGYEDVRGLREGGVEGRE